MADVKEKVVAEVEKIFKLIDEQIAGQKQIADVVAKTNQRPAHVAVGVVLVSVFAVLYVSGANALCNLIGFAYPLYASFKALKTDGGDDDTQWLTYWVTFGFFTLLESLFVVFSKSLFYFLFKAVFLVWAFLPQTLGAKLVFDKLIEPILNRYEGRIDSGLHGAKRAGEQFKDEVKDDVSSGVGAVKKRALANTIDNLVADAGKKAE